MSLVDVNASAFIAECDALGIESQTDTSTTYRQARHADNTEYAAYIEHRYTPPPTSTNLQRGSITRPAPGGRTS
ncbi:hypothetical protein KSB_63540 [Ktedonobacter robiniae]|uniref:Integrase catalytic domain-containing protein n=1 Tax=Ktedonobacter robiniae TaxID=2778365 RepID=A0ABQ3UYY9_9CHLR|nr:hypothetical protein KSB_63540 [Ktedonobacter robiniae]